MSRFPGFIGPTYESRSKSADCQRTVNLYPEAIESGSGKNAAALYGTPGLSPFTTLPSFPVRGLWVNEYRLFAAAANRLYEVMKDGSFQDRGEIGALTNTPVLMYPNGTQLFIVAGGKGFIDTGTEIREVCDAVTGCFLDGYCIAHDAFDLKTFHWSKLYDGLIWDPLDYATKEGHPDNLRRIIASHEDLCLFGAETTEVWRANGYATGTADGNPWERDPGAFIHQGCIAAWSVVLLGSTVAWLGGDTRGRPVAWMAQGYIPRRISTHAIEQVWQTYPDVTDAVGYTYEDQGHEFWVLTFPTGDATWCYDATTGLWHERAWRDPATGNLHRQRGAFHAFVFGKHIVGDWESGALYEMSTGHYTDAGNPILRMRTTPHLSEEQVNHFFHRLELAVELGEIDNPEFTLEYSDNGGKTWSAPWTITAGALNEFEARAVWNRLGSARDRVFRITSLAPMRHAWIDAYLNVTKGNG